MGTMCCLPPFCISQVTCPRTPRRVVFTTTKTYGSLRDTTVTIYEVKVSFERFGQKPGVTIQEGFGMFCARRAVRIFGRRGRSVALRTSICELHSQIHRRTVLLWSAR